MGSGRVSTRVAQSFHAYWRVIPGSRLSPRYSRDMPEISILASCRPSGESQVAAVGAVMNKPPDRLLDLNPDEHEGADERDAHP